MLTSDAPPRVSTAQGETPAPTEENKETAQDGLDMAYEFLKRQISERPLAVLAAAAAAGLFLGAVLSERR